MEFNLFKGKLIWNLLSTFYNLKSVIDCGYLIDKLT